MAKNLRRGGRWTTSYGDHSGTRLTEIRLTVAVEENAGQERQKRHSVRSTIVSPRPVPL
jgi:hypothetical protein